MVGIWFLYLAGVQSNFHSATAHVQEYYPRLFKHGFLNTSNLLLIPWSNHSRNMMSPPKWSRWYHEIGRIFQGRIHQKMPGICSHSFFLRFYLTFSWHDSTERLASVQPKKPLNFAEKTTAAPKTRRSTGEAFTAVATRGGLASVAVALASAARNAGPAGSRVVISSIPKNWAPNFWQQNSHAQGKRKETRNKRWEGMKNSGRQFFDFHVSFMFPESMFGKICLHSESVDGRCTCLRHFETYNMLTA